MIDDITGLFERQDGAEVRLRQAHDDQPLAWALVMAALSWDQVDRRGWRTPVVLCAQARRLMAASRVPAESVDDADRVASALEWATRDPVLLECDGQGHYRPVYGVGFPVASRLWQEHHRAAAASGVLTPLELVEKGDSDRHASPADLDAAEASYRLAVDGDDPDAAAFGIAAAGRTRRGARPTRAGGAPVHRRCSPAASGCFTARSAVACPPSRPGR
ncbi:MAG: hypothetical protein ACREX8_02895 [Gammaproteobacteria bacterium]